MAGFPFLTEKERERTCLSQRGVTALNLFNKEHYVDPTPWEAFINMKKEERREKSFRPLVYICSPFTGDIPRNVKRARGYCRFALEKGYIPIAPHLFFPQFLDDKDPKERELGMHFGNILMGLCREVWVFGDEPSSGMKREIRRARWKHYRLKFFDNSLREVVK